MRDSRLGLVPGRDNNIGVQANNWSKQLFATAANNWSTILLLQQTSVANKWSTILLLLLPLQQTIAAQRKKKTIAASGLQYCYCTKQMQQLEHSTLLQILVQLTLQALH